MRVGILVGLLLLGGCAGGVTYVDEQGNVLAVDDSGKPILPATNPVAQAPVYEPAPVRRAPAARATADRMNPPQPRHPPAGTGYAEVPGWVQRPATTVTRAPNRTTSTKPAGPADKDEGYWIQGGTFTRTTTSGPDAPPTGALPEPTDLPPTSTGVTFHRELEFQPPTKPAKPVKSTSDLGLPPAGG